MKRSFSIVLNESANIDISASGIAEIVQNIRTLLSTKKGTVYLDRLFGLSQSYVDAPMQQAVMEIQNEIYDVIEKYEPRVKVKSIQFTGEDNGNLNPQISFEIKDGVLL